MLQRKFKWSDYEWETGQQWGVIHPGKPVQWYDPNCVSVDNDMLVLSTRFSPKSFLGYTVHSLFGVGLIHSTQLFGKGYFEIESKLPFGKLLWPAFWLTPANVWPPEIDVFEGYSNNKGNYLDFNWKWLFGHLYRVKSNIHYYEDVDLKVVSDGAKTHFLGFKDPSKTFNKYGVLLTDKELSIFFNDRCVRSIKDKDKLKFFNHDMQVIINNAIIEGKSPNDPDSYMQVRYFKYEKQ